jgi:ParB family chromosome partitioning protein
VAKNRFAGMSEQMKKAVSKSDLQVSKKVKNSVIEIDIDKIINPPFHDRYSIDNRAIKELAEDISVHGLINPITVRQVEEGKYQRIAGYRRLEAYKLLGKKEVPAIVFEIENDIDILELMFSENQQREAPSEYDIVVFHLEALGYILEEEGDVLKSSLSQARKIEQGSLKSKDLELLKKVDRVKDLLERTKAFNSINSFYQKMTSILSLDPILIEAIQNKKIYYTIATVLNKATKSERSRDEVGFFLKESIDKNYSLTEAKKAVNDFMKEKEVIEQNDRRRGELKNKIKKIISSIDKLSDKEITEIEKLLAKIKISK